LVDFISEKVSTASGEEDNKVLKTCLDSISSSLSTAWYVLSYLETKEFKTVAIFGKILLTFSIGRFGGWHRLILEWPYLFLSSYCLYKSYSGSVIFN